MSRRRVRTPTVLQMEAVECGAACLAIVLGHHGRHVTLEELRYACGVSRDGSKASNVLKAARAYGLRARGFSLEPAQLEAAPLPLIVFWNFNHFVVVEGFGRDRVFLNDPATGRRAVPRAEFDRAFTGVALVFEPGSDFQRRDDRPNLLLELLRRLSGARAAFAFVVAASFGLIVPGLLVPAFSRAFVDYYVVERFTDWLPPLLLGMAVTALLRAAFTWLQQSHLLRLQTQLAVTWASGFLWHVLRLPPRFFAQRFAGDIAARVMLNDRAAQLLAGDLSLALINMASALFFILAMLQYSAPLTAVAGAATLVSLGAFLLGARGAAEASQRFQLDSGKFSGAALQGMQLIESFKSSGTEDLLFQRWAGYHAKAVNAEQTLGRRRLVLRAVPTVVSTLGDAAILVCGALLVMRGEITIGMLVAVQSLAASVNGPVQSLVAAGARWSEAGGYLKRLDDVLRHAPDPEFEDEREGGPPPAKLRGAIELRDVSFGFSPLDPPFIEGLSLSVRPGARVALVGGSGSGKSTVGRLIAGLYQPWSGEILYDGKPARAIGRSALRASIAHVDQEVVLFEGTVGENIAVWDATLGEDRVVAAAKDAAIHEQIVERPDGYRSSVSEAGRNFSGGQRQRIEIARALAGGPTVLVLDEATSALDAETEALVMDAVRRRGMTCVIIAHRLSTVRDCDEIVVLEKGRIVERGDHATLMAAGGTYRALIEA